MRTPNHELLILGLGNILRLDDGLGVLVSDGLKEQEKPPQILVRDAGTSVMLFLQEISLSRNVIAVDAVQAGGTPGSIYRLAVVDRNLPGGWFDSHGFSFPDVIALARELTGFPENVIIYGVEPLDLNWGQGLSGPVEKALVKVIAEIKKEMKGFLR